MLLLHLVIKGFETQRQSQMWPFNNSSSVECQSILLFCCCHFEINNVKKKQISKAELQSRLC